MRKFVSVLLLIVLLLCMANWVAIASEEGRRNTRNLALGVLVYGLIKDNDKAKVAGAIGTVIAQVNLKKSQNDDRNDGRYRPGDNRDRDYCGRTDDRNRDYGNYQERERRREEANRERERIKQEEACRRAEIERLERERRFERQRRERELAREKYDQDQCARTTYHPRWNDNRSNDRHQKPQCDNSVRGNRPVTVVIIHGRNRDQTDHRKSSSIYHR